MTTAARRVLAVLVVAALAIGVVVAVTGILTRAPRGPESSSYAVGHRGASGIAALLERAGHPVSRQRVPVDLEPVSPSATVVVLGGDDPEAPEIAALEAFVRAGGRLVVGADRQQDRWVAQIIGESLHRGSSLLVCHPLTALPETTGVAEVESTGQRGYSAPEHAVPIIGCGDDALAVVIAHGSGRVVVVADPAVFQNFLIGVRSNAAFALAATGGVRRPVVFLEHLHGFESASGLAALPWPWLAAAGVLAAAGAVAVLARRRAGPPLGPVGRSQERRQHEVALATALAGGSIGDLAPMSQQAARRAIARAARLPLDADDAAMRAAATQAGLSAEDAELVLRGSPDQETLIAATRALELVASRTHGGAPHA